MGVAGSAAKWGMRALLLKFFGPLLVVFSAIIAVLVLVLVLGIVLVGSDSGGELQASGAQCTPGGRSGGGQNVAEGKVPNPDWEDALVSASKSSGVPSEVLAAQIEAESNWDPRARSNAGAVGLTQFIPSTWEMYGDGKPQSDPLAAIRAQGEYMGDLKQEFQELSADTGVSDIDLALAGYNAGSGAVMMYQGVPPYDETQDYVAKINRLKSEYAAEGVGENTDGQRSAASVADKDSAEDENGCVPAQAVGYSGGETTGDDDYPWKGRPSTVNPVSAFYYGQCTDFAWWRLNQQMGGDETNAVVTNHSFPPRLSDGGQWDIGWRNKGWPVDHTPEVGAMAVFKPGTSGADPTFGHIAVVKEILDGDRVVIEEYNAMVPLGYGTRELPVSGVSFYLHIPDSEKKNTMERDA